MLCLNIFAANDDVDNDDDDDRKKKKEARKDKRNQINRRNID